MPDFADNFAFTNVTEAYALFAILGKEVFSIMEKVSALDLLSPERKPPFLIMGPVLHVRSQVVVLAREVDSSAILVACPRGYGQSMAEALFDAGKEWGLRPGGEDIFTGMVALMNSDSSVTGPINIGNPVEFTMLELAEKVLKKIDSKSKIIFQDLPSDDPLQRKPVIDKAKKELDWEPKVFLDEGLDMSIEYFKSII